MKREKIKEMLIELSGVDKICGCGKPYDLYEEPTDSVVFEPNSPFEEDIIVTILTFRLSYHQQLNCTVLPEVEINIEENLMEANNG